MEEMQKFSTHSFDRVLGVCRFAGLFTIETFVCRL